MKKLLILFMVIFCSGCTCRKCGDDALYSVAYLGYQTIEEQEYYEKEYCLEDIPVFYISDGDYYLIIPSNDDMKLYLYRNDIETLSQTLIFEKDSCGAFIVQCNVSDIFPDVTIKLTDGDNSAEFSPYISLKDGSVEIGEKGVDITKKH